MIPSIQILRPQSEIKPPTFSHLLRHISSSAKHQLPPSLRKCSYSTSPNQCSSGSPLRSSSISLSPHLFSGSSRFLVKRCESQKFSDSLEPDEDPNYVIEPDQMLKQKKASILEILKGSNAILPHVVIASTLLALFYPPSFTWFTSRSLDIIY